MSQVVRFQSRHKSSQTVVGELGYPPSRSRSLPPVIFSRPRSLAPCWCHQIIVGLRQPIGRCAWLDGGRVLQIARLTRFIGFISIFAATAMAQVPPTILGQGDWFQLNQVFTARIVKAEPRQYLPPGTYPPRNHQFLVLTLEIQHHVRDSLQPPVGSISWLSTWDGMHTYRTHPSTRPFNLNPQLGGTASTPIAAGARGMLTAIYQLPSNIDLKSLFYTVSWDPPNQRLVLATLPL
jgi:hypothetical protein